MEKWFFFLYSFIVTILYVLALPFLFFLSFKSKYKYSIPARFFLKNNAPLSSHGIWFHVCSFGEAKAIKPLVEVLPKESLRMSTTTQTGFDAMSNYTHERAYLPFEPLLFGWMKPQKVLLVMEAEFWYLLFALSQRRATKTLLINARISDRSYPKYMRMRWLYKQIFKHIDEVYAQTVLDRERLESLGATNVVVTGNIKLSQLPSVTRRFVKPSGLVVCAASTHEGEEELILEAFKDFKEEYEDATLIIAPRHPERFSKVTSLIENQGVSWHRFSKDIGFESDIVLVDAMGELVNVYAISDIVILGGAFVPVGGHNAAEAAQFGCKIISGPHYFNQKDIFEAVEGITIVEAAHLSHKLSQHGLLESTYIKNKSNLTPIIKSIQGSLNK